MLNSELTPATRNRELRSLALRTRTAGADAFVPRPSQLDNGDEARYADKSGTYTKGLLQDAIGVVNAAAYHSFKKALGSGDPAVTSPHLKLHSWPQHSGTLRCSR